MLFDLHLRPLLAAIAGQNHDPLLAAVFLEDLAGSDATLRRGTREVAELQRGIKFPVGELDLPALGRLSRERIAESKKEKNC
jgi:hypothetical protein